MAIKIDLEKAYDRLNWNFILDTHRDVGLPDNLSSLILECISSATMNLIWNGGKSDSFKPFRGIRQGDPLSPYIFVLCIERLSHLINLTVQNKLWKPFKVARK